jgi:DNA-binding NtrC family response regulator
MDNIVVKIIGGSEKKKLKSCILSLVKHHSLVVETANSLESFVNEVSLKKYSILILMNDIINTNRKKIITSLKNISKNAPKTQIILMVKESNVSIAVKALKVGAYQYIKQPVSNEELKLVIETAIDQLPQIVDNSLIEKGDMQKFGEIIGSSPPMLNVYDQILQAAKTDIPIIILGETGTGKDLVAYTIHKSSNRSENPYLPVNLGALPSELVASELFGHEKGAFTGALKQHKGVFEQGSKGTVFLDEIDTMDEKVQVSLLRLLEQKLFKRLGGINSIRSYARLIAATNENLDNLVDAGIFRSDLFYRLDVFRISLPPLRERISDIPLLADEMLVRYSRGYKKNITSISKSCLDALMNFDWPGNVRELKNVIQRAILVCNGKTLQVKHLPKRFHKSKENTTSISLPLGSTLAEAERVMIESALSIMRGNKSEAAKMLGISRRALYNKIEKHNL